MFYVFWLCLVWDVGCIEINLFLMLWFFEVVLDGIFIVLLEKVLGFVLVSLFFNELNIDVFLFLVVGDIFLFFLFDFLDLFCEVDGLFGVDVEISEKIVGVDNWVCLDEFVIKIEIFMGNKFILGKCNFVFNNMFLI